MIHITYDGRSETINRDVTNITNERIISMCEGRLKLDNHTLLNYVVEPINNHDVRVRESYE